MASLIVSEYWGVVVSAPGTLFDGDVSAAEAAPAIAIALMLRTAKIAVRFISIKGIRFSLKFKRGPLAPTRNVRVLINPRQ